MIYRFIDKKYSVAKTSGGAIESRIMLKQQLAEQLHKPVIRKFEQRKVYSYFKNNLLGADLADIQLISKFKKKFQLLLCVIDIFNKYVCIAHLKDQKDNNY